LIVETRYGLVKGFCENGCRKFFGIPYASAPVGELRFQRPVPPEAWQGVRDCLHFAPIAMQEKINPVGIYWKEFYDDPAYLFPASEDCLYLNIWAPETVTPGERLPVAMWIHGGGFHHGFSGEKEFDGEAYARRKVILVTIAYRCNVFGFLAHPELSSADPHGVSGNYGLFDQIEALRWIHGNIDRFGGDPDNITVFGQSAGAMSTQYLISSECTEKMIARAIFQSGASYRGGYPDRCTLKEAEALGEDFVSFMGFQHVSQLMSLSAEELLKGYVGFRDYVIKRTGPIVFRPNIDGWLIRKNLDELIDEGSIKDIPYMIGLTENDIGSDPEEVKAGIRSRLYKGCVAFSEKTEEVFGRPSYVYFFSRHLPGDDLGAFHSSELWYTFGTQKRCWRPFTEADRRLSETMLDYWVQFMKTGDPNGGALPGWEPCRKDNGFVTIFDCED